MEQDDFEIEEYRSLRNSIDMHMKLIPEIFTIMIAATGAILGYGFKSQLSVVFMLPVLIIFPCSFLILSQMDEVMLKGAYIKKRYEEHIFGWESTLLGLRQKNWEGGKRRLYAKVSEDTLAIVLIIDALLFICFLGFLLFFPKDIQLICSENSGWLFYFFLGYIFFVVGAFICTYELNRKILKVYTFKNEQKILEKIDKVFKNNEESALRGEIK